jgi:nitrite reductase/ring-hydroxylating ferredoxin subunit/uncharacterized membrane protein
LDDVADKVQPVVNRVVNSGGTPLRNLLDGTYIGTPVHPIIITVPVGSWSAALVFDGLDLLTGKKAMRDAADASLAVGVASGFVAAAVGFSDWRYLLGESRRTGMAHALLNVVGITLNTASLVARATGRRNVGRLLLLTGYSINGMGAHLGGELSYEYGLRVNRNVFDAGGPDDFVAVLDEGELPASGDGMKSVEVTGTHVLLARAGDGTLCAIADRCGHFSGPLHEGERLGDTVVCPWHASRFDLKTGEVLDGPAVFPQSTYEVRVRDGRVEIKASEDNIQRKVI